MRQITLVVVVAILLGVLAGCAPKEPLQPGSGEKRTADKLQAQPEMQFPAKVLVSFGYEYHPDPQYWISDLEFQGGRIPQASVAKVDNHRKQLLEILRGSHDLDPRAAKIVESLGSMPAGVRLGPATGFAECFMAGPKQASGKLKLSLLFGSDQSVIPGAGGILWYDDDRKVIYVPAMAQFDRKVLAPLLLHELFHAWSCQVDGNSQEPLLSEEYKAHSFSVSLYSKLSDGKFGALAEKVAARGGHQWKKALAGLTIDDLRQMEKAFALERAFNTIEASTMASELLYAVALKCVARLEEKERLSEWEAAYGWIGQGFASCQP